MGMGTIIGWILFGLLVGTGGTLIGAGGGFLIMPFFLIFFKNKNPEVISAISLAVVCANACSGSFAYAKMKRINYKAGILFSLAAVPGAVAGSLIINYIPIKTYNLIFGLILISFGTYLFLSVRNGLHPKHEAHSIPPYNVKVGMVISALTGLVSSLLGIGGGIIHVPMMVYLLNFPVHFATATSHFTLAVMTLAGTIAHIYHNDLAGQWLIIIMMIMGVITGAQIGAKLSQKVKGALIIKILAGTLIFVGLRITYQGL
ncbi:MAG: sulfite exporter TauE/SafE family protein [Phycisphaerales bacterium]